ncbi:MAG: PEP-CTERM sorting domain-containing protein [Lacipirellulaceae bacterium]
MRRSIVTFLVAVLATAFGTAASAAVIYETDFVTKFDGSGMFNAANLQFQDGWLGQNFTTVDPSGSGTANTPSTTAFPRNLNNRGAQGNNAGGPGGPGELAGPGFNVGDKVRVSAEYQFELSGRINVPLGQIGVRHNFVNGGFNASPVIGMQLFYSEFQSSSGGALKLFGDLGRNGFSGADNAFALIASGLDIGLDPDGVAGPADLVSDVLAVSIEMTYLGADQWQTSDLTLANSTTATPLLSAAADKPAILGEIQTVPSGNDLFAGIQWMRNATPNVSVDSFKYEFFAIPEPASFILFGLGACGLIGARRRDGK